MTPHSSAPNGYGYPGHYPGPAPYPTLTAAPTGKAARVLGWILIVLASIFTLGWLLYTLTTAAAGALDASNMLPKGGADELPAYVIPGIIGLLAAMGTGPLAFWPALILLFVGRGRSRTAGIITLIAMAIAAAGFIACMSMAIGLEIKPMLIGAALFPLLFGITAIFCGRKAIRHSI